MGHSLNKAISTFDHFEWSADALVRLEELRGVREYADWMIEQAVIECRRNGPGETFVDDHTASDGTTETRHGRTSGPVSWQRIADALGTTRQSAHGRFAHVVEDAE